MASQTAPVAINKPRLYLEYVSIILLTLIGAEWIGDITDSKFVAFAVGFAFYPFLALFYPKHWKNEKPTEGSLAKRYRHYQAVCAAALFAIALLLLFLPWEDIKWQYQFSLLGGTIAQGAASLAIIRLKNSKASFVNE